jgi:hypothetical protein
MKESKTQDMHLAACTTLGAGYNIYLECGARRTAAICSFLITTSTQLPQPGSTPRARNMLDFQKSFFLSRVSSLAKLDVTHTTLIPIL